jgi:hypothetical protein
LKDDQELLQDADPSSVNDKNSPTLDDSNSENRVASFKDMDIAPLSPVKVVCAMYCTLPSVLFKLTFSCSGRRAGTHG